LILNKRVLSLFEWVLDFIFFLILQAGSKETFFSIIGFLGLKPQQMNAAALGN
jgi:hypothetical protein